MIKLRFSLPLGQSIRLILYERICGALGAVVIGFLATCAQLSVTTPRTIVDIQFTVWIASLLLGSLIPIIGRLHIASGADCSTAHRAPSCHSTECCVAPWW